MFFFKCHFQIIEKQNILIIFEIDTRQKSRLVFSYNTEDFYSIIIINLVNLSVHYTIQK